MFAYVYAFLQRVKVDRKGVTAMEYAVMAAAIIAVLAVAMTTFYGALSSKFGSIGSSL
jgi:Flp pilus assembly pilin Flp